MPDNENRNDPFEEFFQRKAGEYDISYKEDDWTMLERRLDLRDAQRSYRRRVRWIAAASLLIVSMLGYFTFENYNRINDLSRQLGSTVNTETDTAPIQVPDSENENLDSTMDDPFDEEIAADNTGSDQDPDPSQNIPADDLFNTPDSETTGNLTETGRIELNRNDFLASGGMDHEPILSEISLTPVNTPSMPVITPLQTGNENSSALSASRLIPDAVAMDRGNRQIASSRFTLGLVTAPDLSTVGSMSNFYDPGYKLGVTAEYDLGSNFSISAGVVQTMVRYSAASGEYNPPIYWESGMAPSEIIGECLLIDIPLSIKYNFLNFDRSRFFATAGVSSYIMLNEDYYFSYDEDSSSGRMQGWSGQTGTGHWMSNAGFSIGYELDIHNNWSVRAEPFVKVPLHEVGWGSVRLYSTGSFISVHHRL